MFFSVIIAYSITTAFAFCGVVATINYIMEVQRDMGYVPFIEGLAVTMWPLAVATVLLMIIQTACKLERWMLLWTMAQAHVPTSDKPMRPRQAAPKSAPIPSAPPVPQGSYFGAVTPPVLAEEAPEQNTPEVVETPQPHQQQEREQVSKSAGLNFFKLD